MSILIKGMEMPKSCNKCNFCRDWGLCLVSEKWTPKEGKAPDCPLIPVQEHGRLIDADALLDRFERESKSANEHGRDFTFCFMSNNEPCAEWWAVEQIVEDFITTNTVIGAEESES